MSYPLAVLHVLLHDLACLVANSRAVKQVLVIHCDGHYQPVHVISVHRGILLQNAPATLCEVTVFNLNAHNITAIADDVKVSPLFGVHGSSIIPSLRY